MNPSGPKTNVFQPIGPDLTLTDFTERQFEKLMPWQALRILLTPCLILAISVLSHGGSEKMAVFVLALILLVLDLLDANPLVRMKAGVDIEYGSYHYADKLLDQAQYAAALVIITSAGWRWPGDPALSQGKTALLLVSWTWRMLGIAQLMRTGELKVLTWFPDIFKEMLVLWCILPNAHPLVVVCLVIMKMVFEYLKASDKLDIVKVLKKNE